ncbi:L-gulonolactone oxidase 5, partial [Pseudolycoriella hygida]
IIVEVTLNTVELYKTRAYNKIVSDDIITNGEAVELARNTDILSLYWFPQFKEVVVSSWIIVDVNTPGTDYSNDHVPSTYSIFALFASVSKEIALTLTESQCAAANTLGYTMLHLMEFFLELALVLPVPYYVPIYANQQGIFRNPAIGYYDEMLAPVCHDKPQGILGAACVWSHGSNKMTLLNNEFSLDISELSSFINATKDIMKKTPTAYPMQGILLRFSEKSDLYMSTAYGRQTVHFEFFVLSRDDIYNRVSASLAGHQTILQTLTKEFSGRSHWGKSGMVYHNSESLEMKLNETARKQFIKVMETYDPNGVFMNSFGYRLKRNGTKVDVDPQTTHCAILDNCFCSKDSDCGVNQICTTLTGYKYNVCKTRNEVPPITYKNLFPPPFGIVSYIVSTIPTAVVSLFHNCSLKDAAATIGALFQSLKLSEKVSVTATTLFTELGKFNSSKDVVHALRDVFIGTING